MATKHQFPRTTPEEQGVSSSAILNFINAAEKEAAEKKNQELHSFMLLRHGCVLAEGWWSPYEPELNHMLFSLSKSFTSTAVGIAVDEGLLSVDDQVISFFPEDLPETVSENLASMRVRHLLSMSTGNPADTMDYLHKGENGNWVKGFFLAPVEHQPGTHFVYNTGATYMLSAIVQKVTGETLMDYLTPRLFEPLGIEGAWWESCPRGINTGGYGLNVKTEDIARLGQLYLQKGLWNGKRILSEAWVKEATTIQISNGSNKDSDWEQGYGYQFWRCRHNIFRGDGAFGQYCIVMPDKDAVVAITSSVDDMQAVLNLVWNHLLPAIGDKVLPEDTEKQEALGKKLSLLALVPPGASETKPLPPMAGEISGKVWTLDENDNGMMSFSCRFADGDCIIGVKDPMGEFEFRCGMGRWITGEIVRPGSPRRYAASGHWTDEKTFAVVLRDIGSPFYQIFNCRFDDGKIQVEVRINTGFNPGGPKVINGRLCEL